MDEAVEKNGNVRTVSPARQRLHHADVCEVARRKHQRSRRPFPCCKSAFEIAVDGARTADQPRRPGPRAVLSRGLRSGLGQPRMTRQAKIIVGGKINDGSAIDDQFIGAGRHRRTQAPVQVQPLRLAKLFLRVPETVSLLDAQMFVRRRQRLL